MLRSWNVASGDRYGMIVRAQHAELFKGHPALSWLHPLDRKAPGSTSKLVDEVRSVGYDTAIVPHRSLRSAWIPFRARIPRRIGFNVADAPWLLTDRVPYRIDEPEVDRNARLSNRAGLHQDVRRPWLVVSEKADRSMAARFCGDRPILAIAPGSVWPTKRWTERGFGSVALAAIERGWRTVLIGSVNEREVCERISTTAGVPASDNAAGELSLPELLALIARSGRLVANDSAPIHLAFAAGVPVTAIFGPTVPEFGFAPPGPGSVSLGLDELECRPCSIHGGNACPLGHHRCMVEIDAARVIATIDR